MATFRIFWENNGKLYDRTVKAYCVHDAILQMPIEACNGNITKVFEVVNGKLIQV